MKYTVNANEFDSDFIELEFNLLEGVTVTTAGGSLTLSTAEFRDLRKAVGYVWQEVEQSE